MKNHLIFLPAILLIIYTFSPSLSLEFSLEDWSHFETLTNKFGQGFPVSQFPPSFYFSQYGILLSSISFAHKLFGFNAFAYYFVNLLLRIITAFSVYYLTLYLSKKKVIALVAGLMFGISYPGVENTTWATLFWIFPAVTVLCIFLLFWYKFHERLTIKSLIASSLLFWLTIFIYPVRTFGLPMVVFAGELYWLFIHLHNNQLKRVQVIHFLIIILIFLITVTLTSSFQTTPELSGKLLSPHVFFNGLFNGHPPIFLTIWFFIGNLFLPPDFLTTLADWNVYNVKFRDLILFSLSTAILGAGFICFSLIRKKYYISILSTIPLMFPFFVYLASPRLVDWPIYWLITMQIGGALFMLTILIALLIWKYNKRLSETLLLGILLLFSHLIIPWMISPQISNNDQSAFNLISRYYTIPSIGSSIILGCLFYIVFKTIISYVKIIYLKLPLLVMEFLALMIIIFLHMYSSNKLLLDRKIFLDREKHNKIWTQIKPLIYSDKKQEIKVVYIRGDLSKNEEYMMRTFPYRLAFEERYYTLSQNPSFLFISDLKQINSLPTDLENDNFFAVTIKNSEVKNIKDEVLQQINENK